MQFPCGQGYNYLNYPWNLDPKESIRPRHCDTASIPTSIVAWGPVPTPGSFLWTNSPSVTSYQTPSSVCLFWIVGSLITEAESKQSLMSFIRMWQTTSNDRILFWKSLWSVCMWYCLLTVGIKLVYLIKRQLWNFQGFLVYKYTRPTTLLQSNWFLHWS